MDQGWDNSIAELVALILPATRMKTAFFLCDSLTKEVSDEDAVMDSDVLEQVALEPWCFGQHDRSEVNEFWKFMKQGRTALKRY